MKPNSTDRASLGVALLLALAAALALALICAGCVYRGAKITEGTDLAVGINVPSTEGALQLQLLNYLSGFRLGVAENAALTVEYSSAETNSYFGCVYVRTAKRVKAKVEPCEVSPAATNADSCATARAQSASDPSCATSASSSSAR